MRITTCTNCQTRLKVPSKLIGTAQRCPRCGLLFPVNEDSSPLVQAGLPMVQATVAQPIVPAARRTVARQRRGPHPGILAACFVGGALGWLPLAALIAMQPPAKTAKPPEPATQSSEARSPLTKREAPREEPAPVRPSPAKPAADSPPAASQSRPAPTPQPVGSLDASEETIAGVWSHDSGAPWVKQIELARGGTAIANTKEGQRITGRWYLNGPRAISFAGQAPELTAQFGLQLRGDELVLFRNEGRITLRRTSKAALPPPAAVAETPKPAGQVRTLLPDPGQPLRKGNAYLLLGAWGSENRELSRMILFDDGSALFNAGTTATPAGIPGSYVLDPDENVLTLHCAKIPGGKRTVHYAFYDNLLLLRADGQQNVHFSRASVLDPPLSDFLRRADGQPRQVQGEILLEQAVKAGIATVGIAPPSVRDNDPRLELTVQFRPNYPGPLWIRVQPGTALYDDYHPICQVMLLAEVEQTDLTSLERLPVNLLTPRYTKTTPQAVARCVVYPFDPRGTITPSNTHHLKLHDRCRTLQLPGWAEAFASHRLRASDPALELAGRALGSIWHEPTLEQFRTKFQPLTSQTPHWPQAAGHIERVLRIDGGADHVGLWTADASDPAEIKQAGYSGRRAVAVLPNTMGQEMRLVLSRGGRFALIMPNPKGSVDAPFFQRVLRYLGDWTAKGAEIACVPDIDPVQSYQLYGEEPADPKLRFRFRQQNTELIHLSPTGQATPIRYRRHAWPAKA